MWEDLEGEGELVLLFFERGLCLWGHLWVGSLWHCYLFLPIKVCQTARVCRLLWWSSGRNRLPNAGRIHEEWVHASLDKCVVVHLLWIPRVFLWWVFLSSFIFGFFFFYISISLTLINNERHEADLIQPWKLKDRRGSLFFLVVFLEKNLSWFPLTFLIRFYQAIKLGRISFPGIHSDNVF